MSETVEIAGRPIGPGHPCYVVAEIGQNHNGDARIANDLIREAYRAGANAVKFQKRDVGSDLTAEELARPYNSEHSYGATYGEHRRALEFDPGQLAFIKRRAQQFNEWPIAFIVTPCDIQSLADMEQIQFAAAYKIASRDLANLPLVEAVAATHKPVILSRGMSGPDEIAEALDIVRSRHRQVVLMHCVSQYPQRPGVANLRAIRSLAREFNVPVGLSCHSPGIRSAVAASVLGACMIEKHLTFSRAAKGSDHAASLEPAGLKQMVDWIRSIEEEMGEGGLEVRWPDVEAAYRKLGRGLVAVRNIEAGDIVQEADLTLKSPPGIPWRDRGCIVGHQAKVDIPADVTIDAAWVTTNKTHATA